MNIVNLLFNLAFDIILLPFSGLAQFWGIFFISILSGLLLIYLFKITSNQKAIKCVKNKIKAYIFEIRLFDLNPLGLLNVLFRILRTNLTYISYSLIPLLFMLPPVILVLIQLNFRYGYRHHNPGESAMLKILINDDIDIMKIETILHMHDQAAVETGPLRNIRSNYIAYQLTVNEPQDANIEIELYYNDLNLSLEKMFNNDPRKRKISNRKPENSFLNILLNPFEKPLSLEQSSIVREITISYNENRISVLGINFHYIVFFFIFSVIGGFMFKGLVGAEI